MKDERGRMKGGARRAKEREGVGDRGSKEQRAESREKEREGSVRVLGVLVVSGDGSGWRVGGMISGNVRGW
jgi:hypothetical protein